MCDYCEKGKIIKFGGYECWIDTSYKTLEITINIGDFDTCTELDIKYCPFCGEKL